VIRRGNPAGSPSVRFDAGTGARTYPSAMSDGGSRAAAYATALLLCIPVAALAFVVADHVGWLGVVVASGVSALAALVAWHRSGTDHTSARITQRHLAILRSRTKPKAANSSSGPVCR
jgi:hypothetical protein